MDDNRYDWPAMVTFSTDKNTNYVTRHVYRRGKQSPTLRSIMKWCREQGLVFIITETGMRCQKLE